MRPLAREIQRTVRGNYAGVLEDKGDTCVAASHRLSLRLVLCLQAQLLLQQAPQQLGHLALNQLLDVTMRQFRAGF